MTSGECHSFSQDTYVDMIREFTTAGYSFVKYSEVINKTLSDPYVIMRHDLDFHIATAVILAELEYRLNIQSTYFIQLRSPLYNSLSAAAMKAGARLCQLHHDLALHVDLSLYETDIQQSIKNEIDVFRQFFPFANTSIVSFHRPGKAAFGLYSLPMPEGVDHTYSNPFFREIAYFSDGAGTWRSGHPLASSAFAQRRPMQILTHPMRWVIDGSDDVAKLRKLLDTERTERIRMLEQTAISLPLADLL